MLARVAPVLAGLVVAADAQLGPVPELGEPCHGCHCGNVDLSGYRSREFRTPADSDGYVYMFKMCDEIPVASLPEGCKPNPAIPNDMAHPAVVKFKDNNPLDCTLVGSFGPCEPQDGTPVDCGMTYQPPKEGVPFAVTWRYQYGCENTFRIFLTDGHQTNPRESPYNDPDDQYECYWITHWPSLGAFGPVPGAKKPGDGDGGTHWFATLLLWVFVLFVVYLVGGTAFGVKVQGKPLNIEAVPHIHIWRQVGELGKSGFTWTKGKVTGASAAAGQYKGVDSSETASLQSSGEVVSYGASDKGDYDTL
jgi:hypothetical protein